MEPERSVIAAACRGAQFCLVGDVAQQAGAGAVGFFLADLTLAEIDGGVNSYEEIERELLNKAVKLEMLKDD